MNPPHTDSCASADAASATRGVQATSFAAPPLTQFVQQPLPAAQQLLRGQERGQERGQQPGQQPGQQRGQQPGQQRQQDPEVPSPPSYKQLIFGHEDEHHTHWDPTRTSVIRVAMIQAIFRLLQRSFKQETHAAAAATDVGLRKVAGVAAGLEQQVYGLHATPHTYAALLRSRRSLRATLVHVNEVQDKVRFLRRLLKRFSHYMQCAGCSRRGCREFRLLGDHAVECASVRALLVAGERVPCTSGCGSPSAPAEMGSPSAPAGPHTPRPLRRGSSDSDDGEDADTEEDDADEATCDDGRDEPGPRQCSPCASPPSRSAAGGEATSDDLSRHCDILKCVLFHNISCDRHSRRVCGDLGSVLPSSLASGGGGFDGDAVAAEDDAAGDLLAVRFLCRKRAAEQRRQHLLKLASPSSVMAVAGAAAPPGASASPSSLSQSLTSPSGTGAGASEGGVLDRRRDMARGLSIISEEGSCYSCSEVEDECASSCLDDDDVDFGSAAREENRKQFGAPALAVRRKPRGSGSVSRPLQPRPFLRELRSRCNRQN